MPQVVKNEDQRYILRNENQIKFLFMKVKSIEDEKRAITVKIQILRKSLSHVNSYLISFPPRTKLENFPWGVTICAKKIYWRPHVKKS